MFQPTKLINLRAAEEKHAGITAGADGSVRIGALATLRRLEESATLKKALPVLGSALYTLSNVRVRNVATVGGALAHGDPHMDLPPVLIALGAEAHILGPGGERIVPVEELVTGYYETQLANNELISEIVVPPQGGKRSVYVKVTTRSAHDWPALGVAVALSIEPHGVSAADVVISAATERAVRVTEAASLLVGKIPDDKLLHDVGEASAAEAELIGDAQGSVPYKQRLVRVHVRRALQEALARPGGTAQ